MSNTYQSFFRKDINAMSGYTPGEQPKIDHLIKLNTNENPFPPSPEVEKTLRSIDFARLRLYPDPMAVELRTELGKRVGLGPQNVIAGNGSDDVLNIIMRCFTSASLPMACLTPGYSLYPSLAEIQGTPCIRIPLNSDFSLPDTDSLLAQASGANLLMIVRPNAPTGNTYPMEKMVEICSRFHGIVLIDEAYADFAGDNCADLVNSFPNLIVSRTFSKSRALAGLRLGYAYADSRIIDGMVKVKDSYNVSFLTQQLALASLRDEAYFREHVDIVKQNRADLLRRLSGLGFHIVPSSTNFLFAAPPDGDGERYFHYLRDNAILVRYFPGPVTGRFVRITVGTAEQMDRLIELTGKMLK